MKRYQGIVFSWLLAVLIPAFAVYTALRYPIEEHSWDAATFHINRSVLFSAARAEGELYPRWLQPLDAGLGGPLFSFYSPLTYFAMDGLHSLGLSFPLAWRVLMALAMLAAATGTFALVLALSGQAPGALAAAALYVYSFPLLRDYLERGSPEAFSYSLMPWVLWTLVRLVQSPAGWRLAFASLALTTVVLIHNLTAALLVVLLGLVALLLLPRYGWRSLALWLAQVSFGLFLSTFSFITFLTERDFVHMANAFVNDYVTIAHNSVLLGDLLRFPTPYDVGFGNNYNGGPLGPFTALILVIGLLAGLLLWLKNHRWEGLAALVFAAVALFLIWLQTASSNKVWETIPFLAYLQMRTRLLGLVVLAAALVAGLLLSTLGGRWRSLLSYALAALALSLALPVLYPQLQYRYATFTGNPTVQEAQAFSLAENVPGLTAFNEFLPVWRTNPFTPEEAQRAARSLFANLPEGARALREERGNGKATAQVESPVPFTAALHVLYYPGWAGYVDGQRHDLKAQAQTGYILLENLPAGTHTLSLKYEGTPAQLLGVWISVLAALFLFLIASLWRSRPQKARIYPEKMSLALDEASAPEYLLEEDREGPSRWMKFFRLRSSLTGPAHANAYLMSNWWLAAGLILALGIKGFWLDTQTTLLRQDSRCGAVQGADTPVTVRFGDDLYLCGIDLPERAFKAGDTVKLTLYWEESKTRQEPADSFVHLLGTALNPSRNNPLWGQQDQQLPGLHPVTKWAPGKLYRDQYAFSIDADAPPGDYKLELGWWQPNVGQRLKPELLAGADNIAVSDIDSLLISGITIRQ